MDDKQESQPKNERGLLRHFLKGALALVIIFVSAGIWGFIVAITGAPSILTSVGILAIVFGVIVQMYGEK